MRNYAGVCSFTPKHLYLKNFNFLLYYTAPV